MDHDEAFKHHLLGAGIGLVEKWVFDLKLISFQGLVPYDTDMLLQSFCGIQFVMYTDSRNKGQNNSSCIYLYGAIQINKAIFVPSCGTTQVTKMLQLQ